MKNTITTADLLDEYGSALRGSWGGIDGRSEQAALGSLSKAIIDHGNDCLATASVQSLRDDLGICPAGNGHWTEFCDDECGTK